MERGTKNTRPKANLTQDRSTNFITQTYLQKGSTCSQKLHDTSISSSSKCVSIYRRTNQRFRQGTIVRSLFCGDLLVLSPIRCCLVDNHRLQLEVYPSDSKDLCVATYYYKCGIYCIEFKKCVERRNNGQCPSCLVLLFNNIKNKSSCKPFHVSL